MAVESLLDALGADADRDARQIVDAARAEAARICADADGRAARRCSEALASRAAELQLSSDARRARARRDARVQILRARETFLDRVFAAVEAELPGVLDAIERTRALEQLVREALDYFPSSRVIVRCRAALAERLSGMAESLGGLSIVPDESVAEGVIVEKDDRSAAVDNTLSARLRRLRPLLSIELLARIGTAS
jgi:vacuolar-type H+-ATPase subunit E/Vma4